MEIRLDSVRFLVVDTSRAARLSLRILLESWGAPPPLEAMEGIAGFETFRREECDLILCDWDCGTFRAPDLVRRVRSLEDPVKACAPIIVLAEQTSKRRVLAAREAGAQEFLVRPVEPEAFYDHLITLIAAPRPFIRTRSFFGPDRRRLPLVDYTGPERRGREEKVPLKRDSRLDLLLGQVPWQMDVRVTRYADHDVLEPPRLLTRKALSGEGGFSRDKAKRVEQARLALIERQPERDHMMRDLGLRLEEAAKDDFGSFWRETAFLMAEEAPLLGFPLVRRIVMTLLTLRRIDRHFSSQSLVSSQNLAEKAEEALGVMLREGDKSQSHRLAHALVGEIEQGARLLEEREGFKSPSHKSPSRRAFSAR
jgi:two-component system, chemotaxis family, chemotaxis protein CheY